MGVLDLWLVMLLLYGGGILGDNLSYWMGYRYGTSLFDRLQHWPLIGRLIHRDNYEKGVAFFEKRGGLGRIHRTVERAAILGDPRNGWNIPA